MYNGIGIPTPRGSGTSGYIQKNLCHLKQRRTDFPSLDSIGGNGKWGSEAAPPKLPKANQELIEHEKRRQVEIKLLRLEDDLREKNVDEEKIKDQVVEERQRLLALLTEEDTCINEQEPSNVDSHQAARRKRIELAKMRNALNLPDRDDSDEAAVVLHTANDKGKAILQLDRTTKDNTVSHKAPSPSRSTKRSIMEQRKRGELYSSPSSVGEISVSRRFRSRRSPSGPSPYHAKREPHSVRTARSIVHTRHRVSTSAPRHRDTGVSVNGRSGAHSRRRHSYSSPRVDHTDRRRREPSRKRRSPPSSLRSSGFDSPPGDRRGQRVSRKPSAYFSGEHGKQRNERSPWSQRKERSLRRSVQRSLSIRKHSLSVSDPHAFREPVRRRKRRKASHSPSFSCNDAPLHYDTDSKQRAESKTRRRCFKGKSSMSRSVSEGACSRSRSLPGKCVKATSQSRSRVVSRPCRTLPPVQGTTKTTGKAASTSFHEKRSLSWSTGKEKQKSTPLLNAPRAQATHSLKADTKTRSPRGSNERRQSLSSSVGEVRRRVCDSREKRRSSFTGRVAPHRRHIAQSPLASIVDTRDSRSSSRAQEHSEASAKTAERGFSRPLLPCRRMRPRSLHRRSASLSVSSDIKRSRSISRSRAGVTRGVRHETKRLRPRSFRGGRYMSSGSVSRRHSGVPRRDTSYRYASSASRDKSLTRSSSVSRHAHRGIRIRSCSRSPRRRGQQFSPTLKSQRMLASPPARRHDKTKDRTTVSRHTKRDITTRRSAGFREASDSWSCHTSPPPLRSSSRGLSSAR